MDYWQLTLALFFVYSAIAVEITKHNGLVSGSNQNITNTARLFIDEEGLPKLHRAKRHDIEIHRVIKRRPKLPPSHPRGRQPRPPRRPPKPKVKYGPPNVNFPPISHYNPQSFEDTFSTSYETSGVGHGSFGEPPGSYGNPIQPSPAFGSPPFAYGQGSTSYKGSSFGKPNFESTSFEGFGKPTYSYSGSDGFDPSKFQGFGDSSSHSFSSGNGHGFVESPSHSFSSNRVQGFSENPGHSFSSSKGQGFIVTPSHSFSSNKVPTFSGPPSSHQFTNGKQPSYQSSSQFQADGPSFTSHKDSSSFTRYTEAEGPKHQFSLESYKKDPYKTPLTSYEVPLTHTKSNLFEPTRDFDPSHKKAPHSYSTSSVSSTHSTSHSTTDEDDDEDYYPNLPNRYEQEQFHNPLKQNPNKPLTSSIQSITDNDPFNTLDSYYDGVSESQKISVKSKGHHGDTSGDSFSLDEGYSSASPTVKRNKNRRKKKPKPPSTSVTHTLDTDDLRDAFGSNSDFHQVAIDADEFLEFEPQKQMKHSRPVGVTMTRNEDLSPSNFVLLSSKNKGRDGKPINYRIQSGNSNYPTNLSSAPDSNVKNAEINYFKSVEAKQRPAVSKTTGLEDVNILSIQKSNSKNYYAGSNGKEQMYYSGFLPTRRNGANYRSNLDYETLDADDENYDDISDVGTNSGKVANSRIKKDLTNKQENTNQKAESEKIEES